MPEEDVLEFTTDGEAATADAARRLASLLTDGDILSLSGDLGAGKTTFVRALATGLGVAGMVTSPTFNILVVHAGPVVLNHFDLYRLERAEELEDIDFWGVLGSGGVSVIEWGDRFPEALPPDHLSIAIEIVSENERRFRLTPAGSRSCWLAGEWHDGVVGGESP